MHLLECPECCEQAVGRTYCLLLFEGVECVLTDSVFLNNLNMLGIDWKEHN